MERFTPGKRVRLTTTGRQYEEDTGWYGDLTVATTDETGVFVRNDENETRWMNRKGLETVPPPMVDSMDVPELPPADIAYPVRSSSTHEQAQDQEEDVLSEKVKGHRFAEPIRISTEQGRVDLLNPTAFSLSDPEEDAIREKVKEAALRFNTGKPPLRYLLVFGAAVREVAKVCAFGESKYAMYNFCKGAPRSESVDSLLRHLEAYWNGEDYDTESGCHHLAHVSWNALRLCQEALINAGTDDRGGYGKST